MSSEQIPLEISECRYGMMIYHPHDRCAGEALHLYGEYNESEVEVFKAALSEGGNAIDVGAFIGDHTVALARLAKQVVAYEPQPFRAALLRANLAINRLTNVEVMEACAGDGGGSTIAIDALGLPEVALIKIDVDGPEVEVIEGARRTIARWKPWVYVEADRPDNVDRIIETLYSLGYTPYWHLAPHWSAENFRGAAQADTGISHAVSIMLLAVPTDDQVSGMRQAQVGDGRFVRRDEATGNVVVALGDE